MKVYITRSIPETAEVLLRKRGYDISVYTGDEPIPQKELIENIKVADAVISLLTEKFNKEVIDSLTKCKIIANFAVGYNNIDIEYAAKKNIIVTNTPDVLTDSTADLAFALVLACARRLPEGEKLMRNNEFTGWKPKLLLGIELKNKYFGILGAGRIGAAVAERAAAFGCKILYYSSPKNKQIEKKLGAKRVSLKTILIKSDFISVHLPLTPKTFHLLDKEKLSLLKETSILVNTARGEIIDEKELIKVLMERKIFAAGFDVYENEPLVNPDLLNLDNVILLPHIGSATIEARNRMAELAAKNVIAVLSGGKPLTEVQGQRSKIKGQSSRSRAKVSKGKG